MDQIPQENGVALLLDPRGNPVSVNSDEAQRAIAEGGYTIPSPEIVKDYKNQIKYGEGLLNPAKAFAAKAASTATFGLSDQALTKSGLVNPETLSELEKRNPISSFAGAATGVVAPLLLSPEAIAGKAAAEALQGPALAAKEIAAAKAAGQAAELATPLAAADLLNPVYAAKKIGQAVTTGAEAALPEGLLSGIAAKGLGSAVEGAAYGLGQSISEEALGDPELTAGKVAANVGLSALLAGGLGSALAIPEVIASQKGISEITTNLKNVGKEVAADEVIPVSKNFEDAVSRLDMPEKEKNGIIQGLFKEKDNAPQVKEAGKILDVDVFPAQISASQRVRHGQSMVYQSPSLSSQAFTQKVDNAWNKVRDTVRKALGGEVSEMSPREIGDSVKASITDKFEKELAPINQLYEIIKNDYGSVPLTKKSTDAIARNIMEIDGVGVLPNSSVTQLAKTVAAELKNKTNLDEIKQLRSAINNEAKGRPDLKFVVGQINQKLANLEESELTRFAKKMYVPEKEGGQAVLDLLQTRKLADAKYKKLIETMQELGGETGKSKVYGPQDFIRFLNEDISSEDLTRRLFSKRNSAFLESFKEKFPEEFKLIADNEKSALLKKSLKDGQPNLTTINREIGKLSKEVKQALFSEEELRKLNAAQTWTQAFDEKLGPSGTPQGIEYSKYFTNPMSAMYMEARDKSILAGTKAIFGESINAESPKISALARIEAAKNKITQQISSGTNAIFKEARDVTPAISSMIGTKEERKKEFNKNSAKISELANSPEGLAATLEKTTQQIYPHAPNLAGSIQQSMVRGIQYLNDTMPKAPYVAPLGFKWEPTDSEINKWNRRYNAVENPVSVLKKIKTGLLTSEEVDALKAVHPSLYSDMQTKIMEKVSGHKGLIPYKTRSSLSLFMGQDLDGTINPKSILQNQIVWNAPSKQSDKMQSETKLGLTNSLQSMTPTQRASMRK